MNCWRYQSSPASLIINLSDIFVFIFFYFFYYFYFFWCAPFGYLFSNFSLIEQLANCLHASSIRCRDLNPQPLSHDPSALTTRPWLLALYLYLFILMSNYNNILKFSPHCYVRFRRTEFTIRGCVIQIIQLPTKSDSTKINFFEKFTLTFKIFYQLLVAKGEKNHTRLTVSHSQITV